MTKILNIKSLFKVYTQNVLPLWSFIILKIIRYFTSILNLSSNCFTRIKFANYKTSRCTFKRNGGKYRSCLKDTLRRERSN